MRNRLGREGWLDKSNRRNSSAVDLDYGGGYRNLRVIKPTQNELHTRC